MRELWLANQELDQRVADRTAELETALAKLEQTSRSVSGFALNLSHEMRTPLNGVIGMLELLGDHVTSNSGRGYLETALDSSLKLDRLVSRMLAMIEATVDLPSAPLQPMALRDLEATLVKQWQVPLLSSGKLLSVHAHHAGPFAVESSRLHRVIDELMSNVAAHAVEGVVSVDLSLDRKQTKGGVGAPTTDSAAATDSLWLNVRIVDQGPGFVVPTEDDLLDRFSQVDTSSTRSGEGVGIGIHLAAEIARRLDGSLDLSSRPGSSTSATLSVPVEPLQ